MLIILIFTRSNDLVSLSYEQGFEQFKQMFNKTYQEDENVYYQTFCENFQKVQKLLLKDPTLPIGIVPMMDSNVDKSPNKNNGLFQMQISRFDYCSAVNPLPDLAQVHPSVDLREMGLVTPAKSQGSCGCCYAFQTMAIMENGILRDKKNLNAFWQAQADANTLSLSEQYLISNSICDKCNYCNGGTFGTETYIMVPGNKKQKDPPRNPISTVDLTSNHPYAYAANEANWKAGIYLPTKLSLENQLLPIKLFSNSGLYASWCDQYAKVTPVVKIFDDDSSTFDASTINTLKSYLSRGIAVAMLMLVGSGDSETIFRSYRGGGVLYNSCPTWDIDHAVTLVGYGKKNGKDVWVIKNSWGAWWGDKGFFFFEIGKNSYCSEQYAYTSIPKYFDMTESIPYPRGKLNRGQKITLDCDSYFTNISGVIDCYDSCPKEYPTVKAQTLQCISTNLCDAAAPYYEASTCVVRCSSGAYQTKEANMICVPSCPDMFVYNASNQNSKQCITLCPDKVPYYETGACVSKCTSGAYSVVGGQPQTLMCQTQASCKYYILNASNSNSKQCFQSCPANTPFSDAGQCVARCKSGNYSNSTGAFVCQEACSNLYVQNSSNQNSLLCVNECYSPYSYKDDQQCKLSCPFYKQIDELFECQKSCTFYELVNGNQKCVDKCQSSQKASSGQCINKSNTNILAIVIPIVVIVVAIVIVVVICLMKNRKSKNNKKSQKMKMSKSVISSNMTFV
ncbi:Cathepsin_L [Hexamita inflata]|uniref:Cathepsin L n=1 Tax=Hexamita inflata TaxID=28002 RepID=A0AA86NIG8_9EUKA|nr:Cathepsin L [Hexamita inflata]